ncbi:hypothetical protein K466DRAFT_508833 [Polyporus arcularius HHB13444]|uniref:Uncharacterized protein n=1 Tax=Polyporus arcularius HHB13444 TaxID=1314778 RepID=A0A5C3PYV1_9APHY|nr:hypothetical protein K466DRAFT_508833 [Polyporus arcularius HHB13444]
MPKKGANASRVTHVQPSIPAHMKSHLSRAPSVVRKTQVTFETNDREDEMAVDEEDDGADDDGEDDNLAEMFTVLQELQKRKASKSSARSAAFQNEKAALFAAARKRAQGAIRTGTTSIEKARTTVAELKTQETSPEATLSKLRALWESHDETVQGLLGHLTSVVEDVSHRRAAQTNESSSILESQPLAREKSRKKLCAFAHSQMSQNIENQKLAADASALIKRYKALLLS